MPSKLKSTFERAQTYLRQHRIDGWLLHDFQGNNPILWQLYGSQPHTTRRVDLLIPAQGEVRLLVSAIDAGQFRDFPGDVVPYLDAEQYRAQLSLLLTGLRSVAMEYSAGSTLPVVSRVDAGTIELVRGMGVEVVSSADLVQYTVALWTPGQAAGHRQAAIAVKQAVEAGFRIAGQAAGQADEFAVVQAISDSFARAGLTTSAGPIAAVNAHSGDPHYEPSAEPVRDHPAGRLAAHRRLGQAARARGCRLCRHNLGRRHRPASLGPRAADLPDSPRRPRCRHRVPSGRAERRPARYRSGSR